MHAILGYAASELALSEKSPFLISAAVSHRYRAICLVRKRLMAIGADIDYVESNAILATSYLLTMQSTHHQDGLPDYMIFMRGILATASAMLSQGVRLIFSTIEEEKKTEMMAPILERLPVLPDVSTVYDALNAVTALMPLCTTPVQAQYCKKLCHAAKSLLTSSFDGTSTLCTFSPPCLIRMLAYKATSQIYARWIVLPHKAFQNLLDFSCQPVILLHSHWLALMELMSFITKYEQSFRECQPTSANFATRLRPEFHLWLKHLNSMVDGQHTVYNWWPLWVDKKLVLHNTFFRGSP